jgi:hypothetical protein
VFFKEMSDNILRNANQTFNLPGLPAGNQITVRFDETKNEINVRFPDINLKQLYDALTISIGPLFSERVIINEIINLLFHTDFTKKDAKVATLVTSYIKNDSVEGFKLDLKSLLEIENATSVKGLSIDVGCFSEIIEITQTQIDSVLLEPTVQKFNSLVPEFAQSTSISNSQNAYQVNIIKKIIEAIINMIIKQPAVIFILNIVKKISDLNFDFKTEIEDLWETFKNLLLRIFDKVYEIFLCVLLDYLKTFLIKLVIVVTIKFLKEQLEKRKDVLLSLTSGGLAGKLAEAKLLV